MKIDLVLKKVENLKDDLFWEFGEFLVIYDDNNGLNQINEFLKNSDADFTFFWEGNLDLININIIHKVIKKGADISHRGDIAYFSDYFNELDMVSHDWNRIKTSDNKRRTNWLLSFNSCLIKNDVLHKLKYFDSKFLELNPAFIEFGFRSFKSGALVEFEPDLKIKKNRLKNNICSHDKYYIIAKHWGNKWAKYVFVRNTLKNFSSIKDYKLVIKNNIKIFGKSQKLNNLNNPYKTTLNDYDYSVIIPTIGRYSYLKKAIDSMINQSVKPKKIIIVDQNYPDFNSQFYENYDKELITVIEQKRKGQSLARNTGLKLVQTPFVYMFDDDSEANNNLVEIHLNSIKTGKYDISTGLSIPPKSIKYKVPYYASTSRLSTTFDTGNVLMPMDAFKKYGGLDRNYDFGPGTDTDLGTRMYLNGYRIFYNSNALRIHHKAPIGGLRLHNVHKYNTDLSILSEYPPATQYYYGLRYLNNNQLFERILIGFFKPKLTNTGKGIIGKFFMVFKIVFYFFFLPLKVLKSRKLAKKMLSSGVRISKI